MAKIKVGLIGGGAYGEVHLKTYASMPQVEIGAIFTRNVSRREYLCQRYGGRSCRTMDELLDMKEIQAVSIATPEHVHLEAFEPAIKRGKAVYVEKPIASTLADANKMVELSKGSIAMSGHLLRFEPRYAKTYELMPQYGKIRHIYMRRRRPLFQKEKYSRVHPAYSIMAHDYDLANWYIGVPFKRAIALHGFYKGEERPDYMAAMIEYKNGATVIIEGGWLIPEGCGFTENDICSIALEKGAFEMSIPDSGLKMYGEGHYSQPNLTYDVQIYGSEYGALRYALDYFIAKVEKKEKIEIATIQQGRDAVMLIEATIKSAQEGRYITREEMLEEQ